MAPTTLELYRRLNPLIMPHARRQPSRWLPAIICSASAVSILCALWWPHHRTTEEAIQSVYQRQQILLDYIEGPAAGMGKSVAFLVQREREREREN